MTYPANECLGLTRFQKELWLAHIALPEAHPGISDGAIFRIEGCPDKEMIRKALRLLKSCFPLTTATLRPTDGPFPEFETGIYPEADLEFQDFRSAPDPELSAEQWLYTFKEKPFSPLGGSLFRCALIYVTDELSWFINYCFHLAGDGLFIITQAHLTMACYDALKNGKPFSLHPAPSWQNDVQQDRDHHASPLKLKQIEKWTDYLKGLPLERYFVPRIRSIATETSSDNTTEGTIAHFTAILSANAARQISGASEALGIGLSHTYTLLHAVVLSRLYDCDRICIQLPLRFGERRDFMKVQGHRVHIAPLIACIEEKTSFAALAKTISKTFRQIAKLRPTPFQEALRPLYKGCDMSHIWDTSINFFPYISLKDATYPLDILSNISSRHKPVLLGIYVVEQPNRENIRIIVDYHTDYFSVSDIKRYLLRLEKAAEECLKDPNAPIMEKDGLLTEELKLLDLFQHGPPFNVIRTTIPTYFDDIAGTFHNRPAVKGQTDIHAITYAELKDRSDCIGTWLAAQGLQPGQVVAVLAKRHPDLAGVILGIMKAGGIYLPVDSDYPKNRLAHIIKDSGAKLILATEPQTIKEHQAPKAGLDPTLFSGNSPITIPAKLPPAAKDKLKGLSLDTDAPAYVIYTSGSTGMPKGVLVSHRGFLNMIRQQIEIFGQTCEDGVLQFASPSFDASLAEIFSAILSGGCSYPVTRELIDDPFELKTYLEQNGITVATFPPSYLRLFGKTRFNSLKVLITAGEPPIADDAKHYAKQLRYFNAYGPTEASVCASIYRINPNSDRVPGTIGPPIGNTSAYILDGKGRKKTPCLPGELCIGGKGLAIGYLNRPELTRERFTHFSRVSEERLYRTGDLATWSEDGNLIYLGRTDNQLKIRGHRIEPGEVNHALEALPQIAQAACIGISTPEGSKTLHAFVIPEKEAAPTAAFDPKKILDTLARSLPAHMLPSRFHPVDSLPIGPTGKVDSNALEMMAMPQLQQHLSTTGFSEEKNITDTEKEILQIFEQILDIPVPGIHSDFFTLGGDSLLAIELSSRIFATYRCRIPIRDLMQRATVHAVATSVERHETALRGNGRKTAGPQPYSGDIPLNHGQWGIWLQEITVGPSAGYNMPFALEIQTDESLLHRFCGSLETVYLAQPSFKSHVTVKEDIPYLTVSRHGSFVLEQIDLRQTAAKEEITAQWFDKAIHTPFVLTAPPLTRFYLARISESCWRLLLVFHHLIADGDSIQQLFKACFASMNGNAPQPVSPEILARFGHAERTYLASPEAEEDLSFWKKTLAVPPPRLDLFPKSVRPELKSRDGETIRLNLSTDTVQSLAALARETGATPFGCFTALLLDFLNAWTGRKDAAVAVPIGLRDNTRLMETAGYFVNLMVVRSTSTKKTASVTDRVRRKWQSFRSAAAHSRYPFGLLIDTLALDKDPSRWPVTDVIATHIDTAQMLPAATNYQGMKIKCLDVPYRGIKADYTFILHTRQDERMELVLAYDTHLATPAEALSLAAQFIQYLNDPAHNTPGRPIPLTSVKPPAPPRHETQFADSEDTLSVTLLCRGWQEILGIKISTDDPDRDSRHFLLDGGDSIKAIQFAGFLKRHDIHHISPALMFKSPLFGDLKNIIKIHNSAKNDATTDSVNISSTTIGEKPSPGEKIPLLPLQERLFKQQKDGWKRFYMALPMQISNGMDISRIPRALDHLARSHEAFYISFESPGKALFNKEPAPPFYEILDLAASCGPSAASDGNRDNAIVLGAEKLFNALNPSQGRLFGAVLVKTDSEHLLIFGGHHLVLDAVSLDICARDLARFCNNGHSTQVVQPGIATWAKALQRLSSELLMPSEIEFWKTVCTETCAPLKGIKLHSDDKPKKRRLISRTLPASTFYLSQNPRRDLLATLGAALRENGQDAPLFVTLEGHGREPIVQAPDISQAVGWFTSTFPIVIDPVIDPDGQFDDLGKKFDRIPKNGLGYGLVRQHFSQDPTFTYTSQITLNYLGRLFPEQDIGGLKVLPEFTSPSVLPQLLSDDHRFDSPLDIRSYIRPDGCLALDLEFSDTCLDARWIENLLDGWVNRLNRAAKSHLSISEPNNKTGITATDYFKPHFESQEIPISLLAEKAKCTIEEIEEITRPLLSQEGMLFQNLLEGKKQGTYTQQINFRLTGKIDVHRLETAWHAVLNRHKALRTLYPFDHRGEFHCLTLKTAKSTWNVSDFSDSSPKEQTALRAKQLLYCRQSGFDLSSGPLIGVELIIYGPDDHELSLCFHHILMDGWCIGIILDELFEIYAALCENRETGLPPAPNQSAFRIFLARFNEQAAKRYWTKRLNGFSTPTYLATPIPASQGVRHFEGELEWALDHDTTNAFKAHAAYAGVSWPSLIQACWAVLLGKMPPHNPCRDTVFGLVSAGRPSQVEGMEKMVGLFIQTLPVRVKWQSVTPILELAKAIGRDSLERSEYEYYALADIQRDVSISPLFDHILVFETYPFDKDRYSDADVPQITDITGFEKHPYALSLSVIPGSGLTFRFSPGSAPISAPLAVQISRNFQKMLTCVSRNPGATCADLESLAKRKKIPLDNVCIRFKKMVQQFSANKAIIAADGTSWTYADLDRTSDHIAEKLGDGPHGRAIAFFLPRNPVAVTVMLGILKAGGAYLPLDEKSPPRRNRRVIDIAQSKTVILSRESHAADWLDETRSGLYYEDLINDMPSAGEALRKPLDIDPEQPAYIMFTSGSTGEPKGVVIPHRAIQRLVIDTDFWHITPGERMSQTGPLSFDAATLEIWGPLLNGGTVCFIQDDDLLSPVRLQRQMTRDRISLMWLTASLCNLLADETPAIFSSLRQLFVGGEALSPSHMKRIKDACPDLQLINGYGPTENTTFTTTHTVTNADIESGCIPIGKPISQTTVYILDENHHPVADGEWGEICAAGKGLALGYTGRDELTRDVFIDLPAPVGERVYKTGDIGRRRPDGTIEYKGRKDVQVKVRGYRIELSEIETALKNISWVKNAVVLAPKTDEYRRLVAWVQMDYDSFPAHIDRNTGKTASEKPRQSHGKNGNETRRIETALKQNLAAVLPTYMIPDTLKIVSRFPITANGKLNRKQLERDFIETEAGVENAAGRYPGEAPATMPLSRIEAEVAQVFSRVLGKPVSNRETDFFQLGGQSLNAMRMILRLDHIFGIELDVSQIMRNGTVREIAQIIYALKNADTGGKEHSPPITRAATIPDLGPRESYPLSRGQERLWFLQRMVPESPVYGVPFVRRLNGKLDSDALQKAVTFIETRHDALRLRMPDTLTGTTVTQKIAASGEIRVIFNDCSNTPDPALSVAREIEKALETAFCFGYDRPLWRVMVFKETHDRHVLLVHLHHIICDGWSGPILLRDLFQAYDTERTAPHAMPPLIERQTQTPLLRYVDYAAWQNDFLAGEIGHAMRERQVKRLTAMPGGTNFPRLDLPHSGKRPPIMSGNGAVLSIRMADDQEKKLAYLARQERTTLFCVLLTIVNAFLYRHTGQEDILIGIPVAGRQHWQLENLAGFFVNTLVLRTVVSATAPFTTLLRHVTSDVDAALRDQVCPFESLVDALVPERDPSRNPLFDVFVAFEDREWDDPPAPHGLEMRPYPIRQQHSKFDISFYFRRTAKTFCVDMEYNTDLFTAHDISNMAERLSVLITHAAQQPESRIKNLHLLPAAERQKVLYGFNDTHAAIDCNQPIDHLFKKQLAKNKNAVALRDGSGNRLTYTELNHQVDQLARHFRYHGVRQGTPVCLCFERSFDLMVAIFTLMRIGAVYVPVVPEIPRDRLASMIDDLSGCMAYCPHMEASRFKNAGIPLIPWFENPASDDVDNRRASDDSDIADIPTPDPHGTAYIIFTSGSTGRPKGVCIQHRGVVNRILWMQSCFPLDETDVILQKTSISFDVSVWELFWWSWSGASLAQLPPGGEKDPEVIIHAVKYHRITVMHFVPSMLRIFLSHIRNRPECLADIASLKYVFASGEALTPELVTLFNTLLFAANGTQLHNLYGPTEATVDVTWYPCGPEEKHDLVPIGKPVQNTQVYILDAALQPVPIGVTGEIYIAGIQVAEGYVNRPELNPKSFLDDPFVPANRMYRTGDLGRWLPSGDIQYLGRNDNQIKLRGYRIELGEVEAALDTIPQVSQAIVRMGHLGGEACLEAFLVCPDHVVLSVAEIRETVARHLPGYMIPSLFYRLPHVPLNLSGKADRKALKGKRLSMHQPPSASTDTAPETAAPFERQIREIWQHVLPEIDRIEDNQTFFDIGGTSFLVIRLHDLLNARWPGLFTIAALFIHTTIEKQALYIRQNNSAENHQSAPKTAQFPLVPGHAKTKKEAIAVIGMALRLADNDSHDALWADLLGKVDHTGPMPVKRADELMRTLTALGQTIAPKDLGHLAYVDDISAFDFKRFGLAPADAALMDPEQRLFLETALRALEDGGYGGQATQSQAVGVFTGASPSYAFKDAVLKCFPDRAEQGYILNLPSSMASRLGYLNDWSGPAEVVDTACSSSLKAVWDACQSLLNGECVMALAGGVRVMLAPLKNKHKFAIQSAAGKTRPFDENADGVGAGEGAIVFLLKPLSRAVADRDAIRAVILGGSVNQDGHSSGIATPNPLAQANVIKAAAENAGVALSSLNFFEAHGTATPIGDPIEIEGVTQAFALSKTNGHQSNGAKAAISSVKGHFGHLDAAAGALGMARAILSLEHGIIPGQIHFSAPNPKIDFDKAPVAVPVNDISLKKDERPWRCGVSAFSLSGINVHLILEQAPEIDRETDKKQYYGICLSASSDDGLCRYVEAVMDHIAGHLEWPLSAIAGTLITGREHLPCRMAVIADTTEILCEKLLEWRLAHDGRTNRLLHSPVSSSDSPPQRIDIGGVDDHEAARKAVQAYLRGHVPIWPETEPLTRLHLPTVPLDRAPCWPDFKAATAFKNPASAGYFLGKGIRTPDGWIFPIPIHEDGFWPVSQHLLYDRPTLVGMAAVSLFSEAFKRVNIAGKDNGSAVKETQAASRARGMTIQGLTWIQPLISDEISRDSVTLRLTPADQGFSAALSGCDIHGRWKEFSTAIIRETGIPQIDRNSKKRFRNIEAAPPLDLEKALTGRIADKKETTCETTVESIINVGQRWDCRVCSWRSKDGRNVLARLELPQPFHTDLDQISLHPALMDVAVSSALDRPGMIPAGFGELVQHRPLSAHIFIEIERNEVVKRPNSPLTPELLTVHCTVWDANTRHCILTIKDLIFTPARAAEARLHGVEWIKQEPLKALTHRQNKNNREHNVTGLMILAENQTSRGLMKRLRVKAEDNALRVLTDTLPEQADLMEVLAKQAVNASISHILWLPASARADRWALPAFLKHLCKQGFSHPITVVAAGHGALPPIEHNPLKSPDHSKKIPESAECIEPPVDAALSLGVLLAMNHEEPLLFCRYIEIDNHVPEEALLAEVLLPAEGMTSPVFLDANGDRYIRDISAPLASTEKKYLFRQKGCVVFTGGLGAMSLTLAEGMAAMGASSVALIHRKESSHNANREQVVSFRNEQLSRLEKSGMTVAAFSCDVSLNENLAHTLNQIREQMGPIRGVIHTAGIPGDGFLINKSREQFEAVLTPKMDGLRHLHNLTIEDPLDFFIMASSRTALTGAPGQSDYTAANAWMDAFAHWRNGLGLPALSINWNTWANVGMAAWNQTPSPLGSTLLPKQALPVLSKALSSGLAQVAVSMPGESLQPKKGTPHSVGEEDAQFRDATAETNRRLSPEQQIMNIVAQTLGYEKELSPEDDFYALGGDSITGMQIINRLNQRLKLTASVADLFSHSRLKDFVQAVTARSLSADPDTPEFSAPDGLKSYPVSLEQLAVLTMEALSIPNTGYNLPQFLKLPPDARHKDFENALKELIERYEILRTGFVGLTENSPAMQIFDAAKSSRNFTLKRIAVENLEQSVPDLIHPFKPESSPLFRAVWLDTEHLGPILFFDIYHGLADARTIEILFNDLFAIWRNIPLKPLHYQFKDAAWHQNQSPEDAAARKYWLDRFAPTSSSGSRTGRHLPKLNLPGDTPRPPVHTFAGANHLFDVPGPWIPKIRRFVRKHGTTTHVLILSLWARLLSQTAQTREVVIAVAADSRNGERYEDVAGMFASLLPLKLDVDDTRPIQAMLRHTHDVLSDALRHRSFPLNRLLEELKPPMDPGRTQLSEVTFSYMNAQSERSILSTGNSNTGKSDSDIKDHPFERINVLNPACKGDISIFATDTGHQLRFALEYYADYFSAQRIARLGKDFLSLLEEVLHDGGKSVPEQVSSGKPATSPCDDILTLFRQLFKDDAIRETDSFFDLGGHSLLGLQIINRINTKWQTELSVRDLLEHPSPQKLAQRISAKRTDGILPLEKIQPTLLEKLNCPPACYPLSHAQQRLYVLQHTGDGNTAYNMPFVFECNPKLDTNRFADALEHVILRHEILRTCLVETETGIWQKISPDAKCDLSIHQLEAADRNKALTLFAHQSAQSIDLNKGPLLKTVVCHLGDTHSIILLLMHHIISDGWSMQIFFRDLLFFYSPKKEPDRLSLPPLKIQYKDYAAWQLKHTFKPQAAYWKKQLNKAPQRIHLPTDGPGKAKTLPAGLCKRQIAPDLLKQIQNLARQKVVSLATLLLTVFVTLLYRLTRQQDMVIGVGVAGRERRELEDLIGFFINILPIRIRMDDDTSVWGLLDQVHQTFGHALAYQTYPFDLLVREVAPDRKNNNDPLINVMFEYQRYQDLEGINPENGQDISSAYRAVDLYETDNNELPGPAARHDVTFFVQDTPLGCTLRAEFDPGILTRDTVENWLEYFEIILKRILESEK